MFDKLQQIVGRAINGFEAQKIMNWVNDGIYTEQQILDAYKYCQVKTLNYVSKYLENHKQDKPEWFDKHIEKEELAVSEQIKMLEELKEFYDNKDEWEQKVKELNERV